MIGSGQLSSSLPERENSASYASESSATDHTRQLPISSFLPVTQEAISVDLVSDLERHEAPPRSWKKPLGFK